LECVANYKANIQVIAALAGIERTICVGTKTTVNRIYGFDISQNGLYNTTGDVYPGDAINFSFDVFNLGNAEEKISLSLDSEQEASYLWSNLFSEKTVILSPFSEDEISLRIDIPDKTIADLYTLNVKARLVSNSKTKNFEIFVNVLRVYSIRINCTNPDQITDPGVNLSFNIALENQGNHLEDIILDINNIPNEWEVKYKHDDFVFNDTISMEPFSSINIRLILSVKSGTLVGDYNLTLVAQCVGVDESNTIFSSTDLNIKVNRVYGIALESVSPEYFTVPEEKVFAYVEVTNLGNFRDFAKLEVVGNPDGWVIALDTYQNILLYANEKRDIGATITPYKFTKVGTYNIYLKAIIEGDNSEANLKLKVTIDKVSGLDVINADTSVMAKAGESGSLNVLVCNLGNDEDTITLSIPEKLSFGKIIFKNSGDLNLNAYAEKEIELNLELYKHAIAGTHSIPIIGRLESNGENYTFDIDFDVMFERGIDLDIDNREIVTTPGEEIKLDICIQNTGNCKDNFTFEVTGIPEHWDKKFPPKQTITVQPFSMLNKTLYFNIPSDEPYHDVELELRIQSKSDSKTNSIEPLTISLQEEKFTIMGMAVESIMFLLIALIIVIIVIFGVFKINSRRKQKGDLDSDNIIKYDTSSDGSRIVWDETFKPIGDQYNPPTQIIDSQQLDLQVQAPNTYRSRTSFESPVYHKNLQQSQLNVPVLPPISPFSPQRDTFDTNNNDLNYNAPSMETTYRGPERLIRRERIEIEPTPVEPIVDYERPADKLGSKLKPTVDSIKSDENLGTEFHDDGISLKFQLPKSKSQPIKRGELLNENKNENTSEDNLGEDSNKDLDEVKIFSLKNEFAWKRPKRHSDGK
jgi:uncharacterized membrane protein